MRRDRLPLDSSQLELLLAFEQYGSLSAVAASLRRDQSVVSRALARLSEAAPVLAKHEGRWAITPLGMRINALTREFAASLAGELPTTQTSTAPSADTALLVVINAQKGLLEHGGKARSNPHAEAHIATLLSHWRAQKRPVAHVKHVSAQPASLFHPSQPGSAFMDGLAPVVGEVVVEKSHASAFAGTKFADIIAQHGIDTLILTGFTAHDCVVATARDAAAHALRVLVAHDATATFDLTAPSGTVVQATQVQDVALASLQGGLATVVATQDLLSDLT